MPEHRKGLIVVSSHSQFGDLTRKTGYWLEEVSHFYWPLVEAGFSFDFVSPRGGTPPMDEKSGRARDKLNQRFRAEVMPAINSSLRPDQVNPDDYSLIYFAGGHGTMWDFPDNPDLQKLVARIYEQGKVVAAVCHGVSALINVKLSNGRYLIAGNTVSGFLNSEEILLGLRKKVPFLLQDEIKKRGANLSKRLPFLSHAVTSERLVTGQNPFSTRKVADQVLALFR